MTPLTAHGGIFSNVSLNRTLVQTGNGTKKKFCFMASLILVISILYTTSILENQITKRLCNAPWTKRCIPEKIDSLRQTSNLTGIHDDYITRLDRVKEYCRNKKENIDFQNESGDFPYPSLYVDENNKALYCSIPKVGTTIWQTNLIRMSGKEHPVKIPVHAHGMFDRYNIFKINAYSRRETSFRIKNYFKFVFVRHPLTRLLSAYRNKIIASKKFGRLMIEPIQEFLRHNTTDNRTISFEEFASYILQDLGPLKNNHHWAPYNKLCGFCEIQYDFIGRQEFLEKEARYLVNKHFNNPHLANFKNAFRRTYSDLAMAKKYYKQLTYGTKMGLLQFYREDMDMFGYSSIDIF